MRPIDADTLKERLQSLAYDDWNQGITTSFADACHEIIDIIEGQPTIEPERKPGHWMWEGFNIVCSECDAMPMFDSTEPLYSYCPNCGAEMKGEEEQ